MENEIVKGVWLNQVFKYIDDNLGDDLSLSKVASIAYISPFHFHRIFKFVVNETLHSYINRRRIEKSVLELLHSDLPIIELAHKYGFADGSSYAKAFKKYYGVSPVKFKKENPFRAEKITALKSNNGQAYPTLEEYVCRLDKLRKWNSMYATIEIKDCPKLDLAYISNVGSMNLPATFGRLIDWVIGKGLMDQNAKLATLYHDSFKVTELHKVRMSVAIILKDPTTVDGEVGIRSVPKGKFIVALHKIHISEFEKAWTALFLWMNENGYRKAVDRDPFEIYLNNFNEHPQKLAEVEFYIPIE